MTEKEKRVIGILTFLPIVLLIPMILFMVSMIGGFIEFEEMGESFPTGRLVGFLVFAALMLVLFLGLLVYYLVDVSRNTSFKENSTEKVIWILLLLFVGWIAMVVYYFVEIKPRPEQAAEEENFEYSS
ncbi:MAG: hypothetical protein HKN16_00145 [Saprospiraceae bacterium]|nr:hypothetical protein [Saprospiraceae bacterium]